MNSTAFAMFACGAMLTAAPAAAQVLPNALAGLSVSAGADYSSGSYGGPDKTKIFIAPLSISAKMQNWRFTASVPYLRISGAPGVIIGPDGRPLPGVGSTSGVRSGIGDLSLAATATLPSEALGGFSVDLTGRVKLPTSKKSDNLGTGETDYSILADVSYPIGDWAPFVTLGYRLPGDPAGINLKNTFTASAGTSVAFGETVAIVSYDYSEAASPLAKDAREIFAALSGPVTDRVNVTGYGIAGLSDGSPDYEAGLLFTVKFR